MRGQHIKYIDYLLAFLIACDIAFTGWLSFYTLPNLVELYQGMNLLGMMIQYILFFALGIAVVVTFTTQSKGAKWFLLAHVLVVFIVSLMIWEPNTALYEQQLNEMLSNIEVQELAKQTQLTGEETSISVTVYSHPHWTIKFLYLLGVAYTFFIRTRYNKALQGTCC